MAWVHEQPSAVAIDCGCACALRALSAGCTGRRGGLRAGSQWRLGGLSVAVGGIACTRTHPSGPERVSVHVSSRLGAERASECVRMSLSVRVRVRVRVHVFAAGVLRLCVPVCRVCATARAWV